MATSRPDPFWGDESELVEEVLDWVRHRVVSSSDPKSTARPAAELAAAAGRTVSPEGIGGTRALAIFDEVLAPATRAQDDPLNLAYIPGAPTKAAIAFDLVTSSANIFAGLWEAGAGAIFAENEALGWLVELLGWPAEAGGCFVSGGTSGNLAALVAARESARRALRERTGTTTPPDGRWKLVCSSGAHSSIAAAARVMDVEVVDVPVAADGRLTGPAVREVLAGTAGVFAVVASAGTTNAGVIDDLAGIADAVQGTGVWLHVDGAYGGAALAAPAARHLFAGIERADSFIVDPHKWLFAPYDSCALLYRDPELARAAHTQRASYLDTVDRRESNPADLAIHLSRRARGLPFWFSLATHGTTRYGEAVQRSLDNARIVADAIESDPALRIVRRPDLTVLLFERPGWDEQDYEAWSRWMAREGRMLCVPTWWDGRMVLRLVFVNPETDPARVIAMLGSMEQDLRTARDGG